MGSPELPGVSAGISLRLGEEDASLGAGPQGQGRRRFFRATLRCLSGFLSWRDCTELG